MNIFEAHIYATLRPADSDSELKQVIQHLRQKIRDLDKELDAKIRLPSFITATWNDHRLFFANRPAPRPKLFAALALAGAYAFNLVRFPYYYGGEFNSDTRIRVLMSIIQNNHDKITSILNQRKSAIRKLINDTKKEASEQVFSLPKIMNVFDMQIDLTNRANEHLNTIIEAAKIK